MNDCGMISAANSFSNGLQRCICHIFAQIHGDLPRFCHIIASGFRGDLIHRNAKMFRNYLHHQLWCHFQRNIRRNNILKLLLCNLHRNLCLHQVLIGHKLVQCPFQFPDIRLDVQCNIVQDRIIQGNTVQFFFFPQNRHPRFIIRRTDVCQKPPFKP